MLRGFVLCSLLAIAVLPRPAEAYGPTPPAQPDAAQLVRMLDKLQVVGNVLYVAAHPDDENTRFLAWLGNDRLLRAGYLSLTRGDGGQNLIGSEQGPLLGLIRTQELLAARRIDGAEQLFTQARDFGYSKRSDEALAIWGHDQTLADVVLAIRRFKPDVIVTRFSPDDHDTHGHHTASAQLAVEAFEKAADPVYHPEQVQRYGAWRARRVLWNATQWPGAPARDFTGFVELDVGGYSPQRGLSWGELAAESRSMHKSQGFGAARQRGPALEYFKVLAGEPIEHSPLDGVVTDWSRVPGSARLADALARARKSFRSAYPERAIPALLEARDELDRLPDNPWKPLKRAEIDAAVLACAGLFAEINAAAPSVVQGGTLAWTASLIARRPVAATLESIALGGAQVPIGKALETGTPLDAGDKLVVAKDAAPSNPYWLELAPEAGRYPVSDDALIGLPEGPPALEAELRLVIEGHAVAVRRALTYKWTDPVAGERYRAVEVLPAVSVDLAGGAMIFPDRAARELQVRVRAPAAASGSVALELPAGFRATPATAAFQLAEGAELVVKFRVTPPAAASTGTLRAVAHLDGDTRAYDRGLLRIEHDHIPIQTLLPRAQMRVVRVDVARKPRRIGYIKGAGDAVPAALEQLGYQIIELDPKTFTAADLAGLHTIVTGVRAFNVEPRLTAMHDVLMDWVARGGTLVVQYNTNNRIGPAPPQLGPFPFAISQTRTTDETASVAMQADAVLAGPNPITAADFEGWIQERGLYFAETWDPKYRAPLAMSDPGEPAHKGALLVAKYKRGAFIYSGLAFFRQLPAGVPGAYRLFANLIEYGRAP